MSTEDKIKDFENNLQEMFFDKSNVNDCKPFLRERWEGVKKDEDFLALATSITKRDDEKKAAELYSPLISSLVLMDYDNIDSLIYEILIDVIYSNPKISIISNLFTTPNYTLLETSLFNPNLFLNEKQANFLFNMVVSDYEKIRLKRETLRKLDAQYYLNRTNYSKPYISKGILDLKEFISNRDNNPLFVNAPADIRYFILNNENISKHKEFSIKNLFFKHFETITMIPNFYYEETDDEFSYKEMDDALYSYGDFNDELYLELLSKPDKPLCFNEELNEFSKNFEMSEIEIYKNYKLLLQDSIKRVNIRKMTRMPF